MALAWVQAPPNPRTGEGGRKENCLAERAVRHAPGLAPLPAQRRRARAASTRVAELRIHAVVVREVVCAPPTHQVRAEARILLEWEHLVLRRGGGREAIPAAR